MVDIGYRTQRQVQCAAGAAGAPHGALRGSLPLGTMEEGHFGTASWRDPFETIDQELLPVPINPLLLSLLPINPMLISINPTFGPAIHKNPMSLVFLLYFSPQ